MDEKEPGTDYPTEASDGEATTVEPATEETTEDVEQPELDTLGGDAEEDTDADEA